MKVLLANPRGFCAGVQMAVDCLDRAMEVVDGPVYVFHEIVHNQTIVRRYESKGVVFVDAVSDVPVGSVLLFSAHGISPEVRNEAKERKLFTIDATCPLVSKVHLEALRFAKQGYHILLIGHKGHDEVLGTMGEVPGGIDLVETVEEVESLTFPDETKLAYLTQTTLSVDDANLVIDALKNRFPKIQGPPREDICYATTNRQEVVRKLAPESDLTLVLGSQNSSNSQRLKEISEQLGTTAYLIDRADEIETDWMNNVQTILVTAGASAPDDVVQDCLEFLKLNYNAEISEQVLKEERVTFGLPKELKNLQPNA